MNDAHGLQQRKPLTFGDVHEDVHRGRVESIHLMRFGPACKPVCRRQVLEVLLLAAASYLTLM